MAQVVPSVQEHIDLLLYGLLELWHELPNVVETIDDWDVIDQIMYVEELPVVEQRLHILAEYASENAMNPDQVRRYDTLLQLVDKYRPLIVRLYD